MTTENPLPRPTAKNPPPLPVSQEPSLDETMPKIDVLGLSLDEIIAKTDSFSAMYSIGQGSQACESYYYSVSTGNKRPVAVKKLDEPLKHLPKQGFMAQVLKYHYTDRHRVESENENFAELLGFRAGDDLLLLAYEFASMGSLHDILHGRKGVQGSQPGPAIPWRRRVGIALDAAKGVEHLHHNDIIHRNVRSSNVLLFHGFGSKVADCNLSKQAPDMPTRRLSSQVLGSFAYHPPECLMFGVMTQKSDVYSFGVVLLELLTGRKPVDDKTPSGHQSLVNWVKVLATPKLTPEKVQQIVDPRLGHEYPAKGTAKLATLAAACLRFEPDSRPPMSVVVRTLQAVAKFEQ